MTRTARPISARARILGAILAVACVGLAVVGSVTFLAQRERVLEDVNMRLRAQVQALQTLADATQEPTDTTDATDATDTTDDGTATTVEPLDIDAYETVEEYLRAAVGRLVTGPNEGSVGVIDGHPRFIPQTLSGFKLSDDTALIDRAVREVTAKGGTVIGTASTPEGPLRYIAVPISMPGDPQKGVYLRAVKLESELGSVTSTITTYWIAAVAVLIAIAIVGWFVAGRLLSPIRSLRDAADSITISDLSPRLQAEGNDDISDLTRTVNSMLDRLEGSVDVQRQLLDDVRHELKTPITIVRGHLEMMDSHDVADVESAREIGIAELDRMTRLVDDIDLLAAVEGDQFAMDELDLGALTARTGELVAVIAGHDWRVEAIGTGSIRGDHDRLLQAWLQLADNAAKYTPDGSGIEIGSAMDDDGARLWVRDHGAGIAPAVRHRIFRRFDRAQGKRTVGGSGLGLAIVDAITKAHGGRCVVTDTDGGGATFTIHLPLPNTELPRPVRAGDVVLQREAAG